jgi:hypothetical protein
VWDALSFVDCDHWSFGVIAKVFTCISVDRKSAHGRVHGREVHGVGEHYHVFSYKRGATKTTANLKEEFGRRSAGD